MVATAKMATPWRMGCQAPMSWAFSGMTRRNWVVIFQASTLISNRLFTRARTGARGKEATNKVTKPNWMTVRDEVKQDCQDGLSAVEELTWEVILFSIYPFQDIRRTGLVLKWAGARSPAPSEESPSLRPHGCSNGKSNSSPTCRGRDQTTVGYSTRT